MLADVVEAPDLDLYHGLYPSFRLRVHAAHFVPYFRK